MKSYSPINANDAPVKRAIVSASLAADNEIVAAVSGKRIRVRNGVLISAALVSATWRSATNAKSGAMPLGQSATVGGGYVMPDTGEGVGYLETNTGEALNLLLSGATLVAGHISYQLIDPPKQE
jgi:hypothetical protein